MGRLFVSKTGPIMEIHIEVQAHKVELITKLLEHIPFVKIKGSSPLLSEGKRAATAKLLTYRNKRSLTRVTSS